MPFPLKEIEHMSSILCNVVIGIIEIVYPEASPTFTGQYLAAMKSVGAKSALLKKDEFYPKEKWIKLLKVCHRLLVIDCKSSREKSEVSREKQDVSRDRRVSREVRCVSKEARHAS